jgi:hypothetical protein
LSLQLLEPFMLCFEKRSSFSITHTSNQQHIPVAGCCPLLLPATLLLPPAGPATASSALHCFCPSFIFFFLVFAAAGTYNFVFLGTP